MIAERLREVDERILRAAERAGRDPASVTLVAVSKTHPALAIREAYAAGARVFGESYAQELAGKAEELRDLADLRWHFIGHLQRNKVKQLPLRAVVESVGSARLADALAPRGGEVFLQVNVADEQSKSGCSIAELPSLVAHVRAIESLVLRGLMTIPPAGEDPRPRFRRLRELALEHGLPDLSMGMSADLEIAVEEGATLVRVGTAIFGPRE